MEGKLENITFDAVVIGAGFSGLYMLHLLRKEGLKVRVYEKGGNVGGVWYWNRYPGARCDIDSVYYCYTFSEELYKEWTWSSRFADQPEILEYINYVADKFKLRDDIEFNTEIVSAQYNAEDKIWEIVKDDNTKVFAKYLISGVGNLSAINIPNIKGLDDFAGEWYHPGNWPHEEVNFKNKKVGIIGTGSSGIQMIPEIAKEADHLTVFQRTAQYSVPANNYKLSTEEIIKIKENFNELKKIMRESRMGMPLDIGPSSALDESPEERQKRFEKAWRKGGFSFASTYQDLLLNEESNELAADFVREKISSIVKDENKSKKLMPTYLYGTKRQALNTNYFETFNRENVSLIDVKETPIQEITKKGIKTTEKEYEVDIIIFATGYDAITGPLKKMDIRGKNGITIKEHWTGELGTRTYLGLVLSNFPNFFMINGPQTPAARANAPVLIEENVEWISDCIAYLEEHNIDSIEVTQKAEQNWTNYCKDLAEKSLFIKTDSWYTGANIEGKRREAPIYFDGVDKYIQICKDVSKKEYKEFILESKAEKVKK